MNKIAQLLDELRNDLATAPAADRAKMLGELEGLKAEAFARMLAPLIDAISVMSKQVQAQAEFYAFLAYRLSDISHASIAETARILKVSTKTVRRRIESGELTLETMPGSRAKGIPLRQVRPDWINVRALATARERE